MHKHFSILSLLFFLTVTSYSQEEEQPEEKATDSISNALSTDVLIMDDSLTVKKTRNINPLAPSKAAFYSAVLPGLGQIYNKRYWKVPLVWGAIGGSVYAYTWNNDNYKRFRTAFKRRQAGFTDDEFNGEGVFPFLDDGDLENQQERFQRDRDLWLVLSIVAYSLNIIDANVDAHLKQFNIDNNLALDFEPYLDLNAVTNNPTYGMALTIKF
ncbi:MULTISPECIES: DUF5683 domain-containing protein [Maribacter]|uniref:DUF5683 domain-containing protein n=1 Tax=Maribacter flavus TaxID=1658664 RepID=A0ABU7IML5_9FLAO|nr:MULTISPECIES: DUF5683 domain-containing protein [Maribacter]MDC6406953.1 DUF5683 domain-containing protein [Maribacter sp. PR66]MEE1974068.1 DUF5683 domain-containing protein [Maribacter flavus]